MADLPNNTVAYASIILRGNVWIGLMMAALNDLDVMTADIQNTYLNAPAGKSGRSMDKLWSRVWTNGQWKVSCGNQGAVRPKE